MKAKALGAALVLCFTALAQAQEAPKPSPFTFALKGFVSMSAYMQDGTAFLSEGQQAISAGREPATDGQILSFDVRQTRLNFSVKGPQVMMGATPSGVVEIDFFQGFGAGQLGNVSLLNRLRLAYAELNWGTHRLAFGQLNDLVFAMAPTSISHVAFPLGYMTGNLGWRRPGIWGFHNFTLSPDLKAEFAWELGRSQWSDAAATIGGAAAGNTSGGALGEASGLPALEGRFSLTGGKLWTAFVAGHWNRVDFDGIGADGDETLDVTAFNAGGKVTFGPLTVAATGFYGAGVQPLVANFIEAGLVPAASATATANTRRPQYRSFGGDAGFRTTSDGDAVSTIGYWAQVGYNITPQLSAWVLYGNQTPDEDDAKDALFGYLDNTTINAILQYRDGGFGLSAEWTSFTSTIANYTTTGDPTASAIPLAETYSFADSVEAQTNQYMLTATYFF